MTEKDKFWKQLSLMSMDQIPVTIKTLLTCPQDKQEQHLYWLRKFRLTEPVEIKSTINDKVERGEIIRFNNAYVFFPYHEIDSQSTILDGQILNLMPGHELKKYTIDGQEYII
jgi:hypothetical protein